MAFGAEVLNNWVSGPFGFPKFGSHKSSLRAPSPKTYIRKVHTSEPFNESKRPPLYSTLLYSTLYYAILSPHERSTGRLVETPAYDTARVGGVAGPASAASRPPRWVWERESRRRTNFQFTSVLEPNPPGGPRAETATGGKTRSSGGSSTAEQQAQHSGGPRTERTGSRAERCGPRAMPEDLCKGRIQVGSLEVGSFHTAPLPEAPYLEVQGAHL